MNESALSRAVSLISEGAKFGLVSHVDPDGDSAGSMLAAMLMLHRTGKEVFWLQNQPIPDLYNFLPGYSHTDAQPRTGENRLDLGELDCLIVLDSPNISRVAWDYDSNDVPAKAVLNIDHHKDNELFGDVNIVDGAASSTTELLYSIVESLELGNDTDIATNIYTGLSTDTGSFSFSNTTPRSYRTAARLVEAGVDVAFITRHLQCDFTLPRLAFLGRILSSVQSNDDGSIVWMVGTDDMRRDVDFWGSTEQFANYAMRIRAAKVAMLFVQNGDGGHKVSLRSRGQVDVGLVAKAFGGGGHKRAAGCRIQGDLSSGIADLVREIEIGLKQGLAQA
ncbi:MAG: bifunctional oligoribonuclease/PAP phosphatase NrnA [Candidatus Coatesbacteria bacterium]|nr:bifunctional oligoribonuclease/PAP phosphatase NrnA [Candidatus Coatesbacteria bacterium]